jgi:hypothetical protein
VSVDGIRGHCPNIERAADTNRLLMDFFARQDKEVSAT